MHAMHASFCCRVVVSVAALWSVSNRTMVRSQQPIAKPRLEILHETETRRDALGLVLDVVDNVEGFTTVHTYTCCKDENWVSSTTRRESSGVQTSKDTFRQIAP